MSISYLRPFCRGALYRIELPNDLRAGQTITLEIEVAHAHALRLYPTEITQAERQLVLYKTNAYYYSRYTTQTQKTTVTLPTDRAESYTQTPKPVAKSEQTITYGPYENIAALTRNDISLHYENNNPFLTVSNLKRWIEVSHWGNIAVEETIDVYHSGAKLKGSFSRLDFQRRQDSYSAVKTFREIQDQFEVEIRPRFPLYGGWKTHYILGYNVPSYQYLFNK
jgi:oligosaccharyltransferase complex subunit alpha (ribophorin I)